MSQRECSPICPLGGSQRDRCAFRTEEGGGAAATSVFASSALKLRAVARVGLRMARENNEQVRHLAPLVRTLEEAFFEKLDAAAG